MKPRFRGHLGRKQCRPGEWRHTGKAQRKMRPLVSCADHFRLLTGQAHKLISLATELVQNVGDNGVDNHH